MVFAHTNFELFTFFLQEAIAKRYDLFILAQCTQRFSIITKGIGTNGAIFILFIVCQVGSFGQVPAGAVILGFHIRPVAVMDKLIIRIFYKSRERVIHTL